MFKKKALESSPLNLKMIRMQKYPTIKLIKKKKQIGTPVQYFRLNLDANSKFKNRLKSKDGEITPKVNSH